MKYVLVSWYVAAVLVKAAGSQEEGQKEKK